MPHSTASSRRPTRSSPRAAGRCERPPLKSFVEDSGSGPHPRSGLSRDDHGRGPRPSRGTREGRRAGRGRPGPNGGPRGGPGAEGSRSTRVLCESLAKAAAPMKVALIEALRQRGDPAAAPSLAAYVTKSRQSVRLAAIAGLGEFGDDFRRPSSSLKPRARFRGRDAGGTPGPSRLKRGDVTRSDRALATGKPPERKRRRGPWPAAATRMPRSDLTAAVNTNTGSCARLLCSRPWVSWRRSLTFQPGSALTTGAKDDPAREEARDALSAACARLQAASRPAAATSIVKGLAGAGPQGRGALLQAGSALLDEHLVPELRRALSDPDPSLPSKPQASALLARRRTPGLL